MIAPILMQTTPTSQSNALPDQVAGQSRMRFDAVLQALGEPVGEQTPEIAEVAAPIVEALDELAGEDASDADGLEGAQPVIKAGDGATDTPAVDMPVGGQVTDPKVESGDTQMGTAMASQQEGDMPAAIPRADQLSAMSKGRPPSADDPNTPGRPLLPAQAMALHTRAAEVSVALNASALTDRPNGAAIRLPQTASDIAGERIPLMARTVAEDATPVPAAQPVSSPDLLKPRPNASQSVAVSLPLGNAPEFMLNGIHKTGRSDGSPVDTSIAPTGNAAPSVPPAPVPVQAATTLSAIPATLRPATEGEQTSNLSMGDDLGLPSKAPDVTGAGPSTAASTQSAAKPVILQIVQFAPQPGQQAVDITLNPEELGKLRLSLHTVDGALTLSITADRQETLDLLRRNVGDLGQQFAALGYDTIDFQFHSGASHQDDPDRAGQTGGTALMDASATDASADSPRILQVTQSGLDLRF